MGWELRLIALYLEISECYKQSLWFECERFSNGGYKRCTDEEILTVYLFGILAGFRSITKIHQYALGHLRDYFPGLPGYAAFVHRINRLSEALRALSEMLQSSSIGELDGGVYLVDSFPIALAKGQHAYTARVAKEVASIGYNATKKMYFYGVKAHVVARKRTGTLPDIELLILDEAARHDGPVFDQLRQTMGDNLAFADKAYKRPDEQQIELEQNLKVITPPVKARGQKVLSEEQAKLSKAIAKIRQPIETLFGWIQRKTGIQEAGLVRSTAGLAAHIFGKLAAALMARKIPGLDF